MQWYGKAWTFFTQPTITKMTLTEQQQQAIYDSVHKRFAGQYADGIAKEIIEAISEPAPPQIWRPGEGDEYYVIKLGDDDRPDVERWIFGGDDLDEAAARHWNQFQTRDKAEAVARWQTAQRKLCMVADAVNEGWAPDWENGSEPKFTLFGHGKQWKAIYYSNENSFGLPVFRSREAAERAIKMMGEHLNDLLLEQA